VKGQEYNERFQLFQPYAVLYILMASLYITAAPLLEQGKEAVTTSFVIFNHPVSLAILINIIFLL
jgi:hypothetical protein